jgi:hypothetical protein
MLRIAFTTAGSLAALAGAPGLLYQGNSGPWFMVPFGDGLRCVGGGIVRLETLFAGLDGRVTSTVEVPALGGFGPGDTKYYQFWYRDTLGACAVGSFNTTNAIEITWAP